MISTFSLHNVYGDHMVFQRGRPIRVAGTAPAKTGVSIRFAGRDVAATAGAGGTWEAVFPAMEAGGPYELTATSAAGASVTFRDIAVGEVWLCSGQSNMEYKVLCDNYYYSLRDGREVAERANDPGLRLFQVQHAIGPDGPCDNVPAGCAWLPATTPEAVRPFSAVGYWFGVFLRQTLGDVPVGVINASWGGMRIEPWIDRQAYEAAGREHELLLAEAARILGDADAETLREQYRKRVEGEFNAWLAKFHATDPAATAAALRDWAKPEVDEAAWSHGPLEKLNEGKTEGVAWFRRVVGIPSAWAGRPVLLHFDGITDCDETFVDGVKVGETSTDTPCYWNAPRDYALPAAVAAPGRHVVAVRLINHFHEGAILGAAWLGVDGGAERLSLREGEWSARREFVSDKAKIGVRPDPPSAIPAIRDSPLTPTLLYNGMIHPFTAMHVRGFVWYQGCANTGDPDAYRILQPMLIESWRRAFRSPEAAFLVTQLSAFEQHRPQDRLPDDFWKALQPQDGGYPRVREVQGAMRTHPNTGVAVTIDIGDPSDIHPHNKKDVAFRLAKQAERICYGCPGVVEGPLYDSMRIEGDRIRIAFANLGGGLVARGGAIGEHSFAIAGADGRYVWADAQVEGDTVVVWSAAVPEPANVRYAWGMCPPNPNLYNAEGFPAYPFRTDADPA